MLSVTAFAHAGRVCDLSFSACPGRFSGSVLKVPPEYIRLDARIPYCSEYVRLSQGSAQPPAIMFIIDNSGSMDENDPDAARFDVVSSLLDDIRSAAPSAQVGLVVFTRRLAFDHRENPFFRTAFPADTSQHDSFVPLTALDTVFPDGRTGLDTLKALLKHDERGNLAHATRLPASRANMMINRYDTRNGTDISLGFMAAKAALRDAKADPSGRFFVFLSDGMPSTPDIGREALQNEFIAGTGAPATFTVFFDTRNSVPTAPPTIVQMTANIRANGYGSENPKSAYWAINQPGAELEQLLRANVVGKVLSVPAQPKEAVLVSGDETLRAPVQDGSGFVFARRVNLKADTTRLQIEYAYSYADTVDGKPAAGEKRVPYLLTIVRAPAAAPPGVAGICRDQAEVGLFRDGQPVSAVGVDDARLEARLRFPDGAPCPGCTLEAMAAGRSKDHETLSLAPGPGYLSAALPREESASPVPGDGRLQHSPFDSIVVLYVSPDNPLDQVRRAYPYRAAPTRLDIRHDSGYARPSRQGIDPGQPQFVFGAPPDLRAAPGEAADRWRLDPAPPAEAFRYAGLGIEASRAFSAEIRVFSNLGEFVNKVGFTVPPGEFEKLPPGPDAHSRSLRVLWDGRSRSGAPVATGAYIVKTTVRLLPIPGIAEEQEEKTVYRRVGVVRAR